MSKIKVVNLEKHKETFFDRQERIEWWDQDRIRNAKILVGGAGAIGNEVVKNLVLLGLRNILICDFDEIETSNLSRTILFGPSDIGKKKAEVAAQRASEMALQNDGDISWFHGDIVWDFGWGLYSEFDIVISCFDNIEARRALAAGSKRNGKPFIDAGISGLSGHVSIYPPDAAACYTCNLSDTQLASARRRYSCDDVRRLASAEEKVPTIQVSSAIVAAIQCQEAIKFIMGQSSDEAQKIVFSGTNLMFDTFALTRSDLCEGSNHFQFEAIDLPIRSSDTVNATLDKIEKKFGGTWSIDLSGDRYIIESVKCRECSNWINLDQPFFSTLESDLYCGENGLCEKNGAGTLGDKTIPAKKIIRSLFDREWSQKHNLCLADIGIPSRHIFVVKNEQGVEKTIRMMG